METRFVLASRRSERGSLYEQKRRPRCGGVCALFVLALAQQIPDTKMRQEDYWRAWRKEEKKQAPDDGACFEKLDSMLRGTERQLSADRDDLGT